MKALFATLTMALFPPLYGAESTHYQSCRGVVSHEGPQEDFQKRLRKRVYRLVEGRMLQFQNLRHCFEEEAPSPICQQKVEETLSRLPSLWREMRAHLVFSRPLQLNRPTLSHRLTGLASMPGLSPEEQKNIVDKWIVETWKKKWGHKLSRSFPYHHVRLSQSLFDQNLRKESELRYYAILGSMPLLGYIKSESPSHQEIIDGLNNIEDYLQNFLTEVNDPSQPELILSFKPLVEELLMEHPEYCPDAEDLAEEVEQSEAIRSYVFLGAAVTLALPCFSSGPVGLSFCLAGGLGVGWYGHQHAQGKMILSRGRALTGPEYEKMDQLNQREKELFWEKVFLPLAFWGTTAVPLKAARELLMPQLKRKSQAQSLLARKLTKEQSRALEKAHQVGKGEAGKNGSLAAKGNYTAPQIAHKARILRESGYNRLEIRRLMKAGVVGDDAITREHTLTTLLVSQKEFPRLFAESIKHNAHIILQKQHSLIKKLRDMKEFHQQKKMRPPKLLDIKIISGQVGLARVEKMLDPELLKGFGDELADMIPHGLKPGDNISEYFLGEVQKILSTPRYAIAPNTLTAALAATIKDKSIKREIFAQLQEGRFDLLERHLPLHPEKFGFEPKRLIGLKMGKSKQYYLDALKGSYHADKRLNNLMALSIFSREIPLGESLDTYLRTMNEEKLDFLIDPHIRNDHIGLFTQKNTPHETMALKNVLDARLKHFAKKLFSHKISVKREITEIDSSLNLVEVPPELGIFRGNVGDDCATTHSFGYANSPLERVFIIHNKRGEEVGYLNGSHITLPNGEKGFFINTIAGKNISGAMTDTIFSGMEKAKEALGVEKIVLLGNRQEKNNINYIAIRDSYQKHRGQTVRLSFPDEKIRDVIDQGSYDSAKYLEEANLLDNTNSNTAIFVREQEKRNNTSIKQFLEGAKEITQAEFQLIFHNALDSSTLSPELLEKMFLKGFDIDVADKQGNTLFQYYLHHPSATIDGIKIGTRYTKDIQHHNKTKKTLLHTYAENPNATLEGIKYLETAGVDILAKNTLNDTAFHTYMGNHRASLEGIKYFTSKGININAQGASDNTLLHLYAMNPSATPEGIKYFIGRGANIRTRNKFRDTPLRLYLDYHDPPELNIVRLLEGQARILPKK